MAKKTNKKTTMSAKSTKHSKVKKIVASVVAAGLLALGGIYYTSSGATCHARGTLPNNLPDSKCTPGTIDSSVTQANIQQTICVSGYSGKVRPPTSYTNNLKTQQIKQYGYTDTNPKDYEEDHLISLELGGNPTDPKNLWPEPGGSPNPKDTVENRCHKQVCDGTITLKKAQQEIAKDWTTACPK